MLFVGFAKVATSAKKAKAYGYLRKSDEIVINRNHILHRAKELVLEMAPSYEIPKVDKFKLRIANCELANCGQLRYSSCTVPTRSRRCLRGSYKLDCELRIASWRVASS